MSTYRLVETDEDERYTHRIDVIDNEGEVSETEYVVADVMGFDAICEVQTATNLRLVVAADDPRQIAAKGSLERLADKFWDDTLEDEALEMAREAADLEATRREAEWARRG